MQKVFRYIVLWVALLTFGGCGSSTKAIEWGEVVYTPHSAEGYEIVATEGESTVLRILSPWPGSTGVVKEIFISRNSERAPEGFGGVTVKSSPERVICMSSSHIAFIDAVGGVSTVVGVSGSEYISNEHIRSGVKSGAIREVGYDTNINYEMIVASRPDVVFIYGTTGENGALSAKLGELKIPYVYVSDHAETTPLGKSEWVVAIGEIFDCREEAEELFGEIGERYESLRLSALDFECRPKVMLNSPYKDTWFVPADDSYVVRLIEDAGAEYVCKGSGSSNLSRPISGESAYMYLLKSDFWIHPNSARDIGSLTAENPKFKDCPAVAARRVYNCTALSTPAGGSDFWESGALRADLVLADLIAIFHPEEANGHELYYYEQLR